MAKSAIEWTDQVWNPVTGCTPIASGCKHCYAREMHRRLRAMGSPKYQSDFSEVRCHPDQLEAPLHWRKPRMVFVNSMSDLFHEDVPFDFVDEVIATIDHANWHTYQILTKRADRMREYFTRHLRVFRPEHWSHLWLGASASTQEDLDRVVPNLLATPAAVRFLSLEPLLGAIDLERVLCVYDRHGEPSGPRCNPDGTDAIGWVIVGGESGPHRRPCDTRWIESIIEQCTVAGVPLFVKQCHFEGRVVKMPWLPASGGRVWDQMPGDAFEVWRDWFQKQERAGNTLSVEEVEANRRDERDGER